MNEGEAITRAEAWYRQRYHVPAAGHLTLDAQGQALRDAQFLGIDLVPERGAEVVNVLVDLTGAEPVALLDEGVLCPRCVELHAGKREVQAQEAEPSGEGERARG